jgi:predicted transposase YdaD
VRFYQEAKAEGLQQGRQAEACALIVRQLTRRLQQQMSEEIRSRLANLPLPVLEDLSEALLDFATDADLQAWLEAHQSEI